MTTATSYDPKDDFFNTGTNFINSLTLTTGNKNNQTFASISSTNSKGIVPNNEYDRLNFTIRNTSTFLNDKLQLDLGASLREADRPKYGFTRTILESCYGSLFVPAWGKLGCYQNF